MSWVELYKKGDTVEIRRGANSDEIRAGKHTGEWMPAVVYSTDTSESYPYRGVWGREDHVNYTADYLPEGKTSSCSSHGHVTDPEHIRHSDDRDSAVRYAYAFARKAMRQCSLKERSRVLNQLMSELLEEVRVESVVRAIADHHYLYRDRKGQEG